MTVFIDGLRAYYIAALGGSVYGTSRRDAMQRAKKTIALREKRGTHESVSAAEMSASAKRANRKRARERKASTEGKGS